MPPDEVLKLCSSLLDATSFISCCKANKQLRRTCLTYALESDQRMRELLESSIVTAREDFTKGRPSINQVKWVLQECFESWGIIPLPTKLNLQNALLLAGADLTLVNLLIKAGARVTTPFLLSAAVGCKFGLGTWLRAHGSAGLSTGVSPMISNLCLCRTSSREQLQQLPPDLLFNWAATALSSHYYYIAELHNQEPMVSPAWTPTQVQHLLLLLVSGRSMIPADSPHVKTWLTALTALPSAAELKASPQCQAALQSVLAASLSGSLQAAGLQHILLEWIYSNQPLSPEQWYDLCMLGFTSSPKDHGSVRNLMQLAATAQNTTDPSYSSQHHLQLPFLQPAAGQAATQAQVLYFPAQALQQLLQQAMVRGRHNDFLDLVLHLPDSVSQLPQHVVDQLICQAAACDGTGRLLECMLATAPGNKLLPASLPLLLQLLSSYHYHHHAAITAASAARQSSSQPHGRQQQVPGYSYSSSSCSPSAKLCCSRQGNCNCSNSRGQGITASNLTYGQAQTAGPSASSSYSIGNSHQPRLEGSSTTQHAGGSSNMDSSSSGSPGSGTKQTYACRKPGRCTVCNLLEHVAAHAASPEIPVADKLSLLDLAAAHREEGLLGCMLRGLAFLAVSSTVGTLNYNATASAGCGAGGSSSSSHSGLQHQQPQKQPLRQHRHGVEEVAEGVGVLTVGGYQQLVTRGLQQHWPVHGLEQLLRQRVEEPGLSRGQIGELLRVAAGAGNKAGHEALVGLVIGADEVWMEQVVEQRW